MIFVFGSNRAGRHGKGAALTATRDFGAKRGVGEGRTGDSYAIPTKDENLRTLPLSEVEKGVSLFCEYARANPDLIFALTPVGTGLAGLNKRDIALLFRKYRIPSNVYLTSSWISDG